MPAKKSGASTGDGAEKRDNKNENNSEKKDDFANKMWKKINKSVSKDKIDDLKGEIKNEDKPKRNRRRRPKKKTDQVSKDISNKDTSKVEKISDGQPKGKSKEKVQEWLKEEPKKEPKQQIKKPEVAPVNPFAVDTTPKPKVKDELQPATEVVESAPQNPFATPVPEKPASEPVPENVSEGVKPIPANPFEAAPAPSPAPHTNLPPRDYEVGKQEGDSEKGEFDNSDEYEGPAEAEVPAASNAEPINPFDSYKPAPNLQKKALDVKPLDRKAEAEIKSVKPEVSEEVSPEDKKHAEEKMAAASEESSVAEAGTPEPEITEKPTSEVREVVSEVPVAEKEDLGGHVEPPVVETLVDKAAKKEEFKEEFWSILEQSGITKGLIIKIAIGIIVLVIGIMSFGTIKNLIFGGDEDTVITSESTSEVTEVREGEIEDNNRLPLPESIKTSQAFPIISSYIFGLEYKKSGFTPITALPIGEWGVDKGVEAAFALGGVLEPYKAKISYYADVLRRMTNMYNTDVYALLDNSLDRRPTLENHLDQLAALIKEADSAFIEIGEAMDNFDRVYESTSIDRDASEEEFFLSTQELRGIDSYENLELFVGYSQEAMRIKAYYNGYKMMGGMIAVSLDKLEPRFDDISSNTEALVNGLRVFDVPASDIEAIIPISIEL